MEDFNVLRKIKFALKCVIFLAILGICLFGVNRILVEKRGYNETWTSSNTFLNFYNLPEESVDVLFLGSSRSASTLIPQVLYDDYGITSYNLGSARQNVVMSYFLLKEALRFQSPKAVVLETYVLFDYMPEEALNSSEPYTRYVLDFMKWGPVKREAIRTVCALDPEESIASYYLPNIRFHSRWVDLDEDDFSYGKLDDNPALKGYTALNSKYESDFEPYEEGSSEEREAFHSLMLEYFQRMVRLCRDENIDLILMNVPYEARRVEQYNTLKDYTREYDLKLLDFNEKTLYEDAGLVYSEDMADNKHCNFVGAAKITDYVGKVLSEEYGLEAHTDEEWNAGEEEYRAVVNNCQLAWTEDFSEYIDRIKDSDRYTVFVAVKGSGAENIRPEMVKKMKELGLETDLTGYPTCSYCAVISSDGVQEKLQVETVSLQGLLREGRSNYVISSSGADAEETCSIVIDGKEKAVNRLGINFVVYDNEKENVVDAVSFYAGEEKINAVR